MSITAMKQWMEALEWAESLVDTSDRSCQEAAWAIEKAIPSLRTAIQEAEACKPVAWLSPWRNDQVTTDYDAYGKHGIPLYLAPPQPAKPLTHAQAKALVEKHGSVDPLNLIFQVEAAHGIKEQP